ncbi:response regulator [Paludisphaera borealis]|uniref:Phosphate regulon transcriptional regulatory protein PhoB n=1 Tax=Paludisphaera borealis TaxID=1387353 RepID=A0A1U7CJ42_9BACT|nr:response regulator [Paludisphaera borealis]APW58949.1 Phosphate regulon transcriptional regulatory protein PhoB [Paludisphaera borealis]
MSDSRRILIVEDEPNVRLVFCTALLSNDYTLSTAADGESALRWLKQEPADVVLLDLHMPGMGGMGFLRRLREAGIDVPVVIVSAHDQVPNVVQAMRLGAIDFVPKPVTPEALRRIVAEVLSRTAKLAPPAKPEPKAAPASASGATADALTRAKAAFNRRAFGDAEAALRQAIGGVSRCAEGHYLLGVLHELRGERHAAYSAYRAAVQADPEFEPATFHLMKYFDDKLM